jgi:hypothetical protein
MTRIFSISCSLSIALFVLFGFQTTFTSCTKTTTHYDTVTVTKTDTTVKTDSVSLTDTAVTVQLLTTNPWELQYTRMVSGDSIIYYTRGGAYNEDFDAEYITFSSNLTGTFVDPTGTSHSFTWSWTNATNTQITLIISTGIPLLPAETVVWDNLRFKNDSLLYDQYDSFGTVNQQAECIMIPLTTL